MLHDILTHMDLMTLGKIGLIMFMSIFAIVVIWATTRTRDDVSHWARLPIETDSNDVHPEERL